MILLPILFTALVTTAIFSSSEPVKSPSQDSFDRAISEPAHKSR